MAVIVPVEPGGTLGLVQLIGEEFGHVQVTPPAFATATETNAALAGNGSEKVAVLQLLGPVLVITCVYVILLPLRTGFGVPLSVTAKSQTVET
jgi:hypothetical protein